MCSKWYLQKCHFAATGTDKKNHLPRILFVLPSHLNKVTMMSKLDKANCCKVLGYITAAEHFAP